MLGCEMYTKNLYYVQIYGKTYTKIYAKIYAKTYAQNLYLKSIQSSITFEC